VKALPTFPTKAPSRHSFPDTALYSEEVDAECKGLLGKSNNCHIIFFLGLDARKMKAISSDTTFMRNILVKKKLQALVSCPAPGR
jgi:hypothetical protein